MLVLGLVIGIVMGLIAMYLFAKNSPQHFIKSSNKLESVITKVKNKIKG